MIDLFSVGQLLGILSFGLGISTFYQKNDRQLKILMLIFNINHLLHYLLLGSLSSALAAALSAARTTASICTHSKRIAWSFIVLSVVVGVVIADDYSQLLPILGTTIGTYSMFMLKGMSMRIGFLFGGVCWLSNNILVGSVGGTLLEVTLLATNLVTIKKLCHEQQVASTH
ncbi:YgjV family protein [Vibrio parahaemolyticus]|uniref:YgjV family protein n=1 Tax=Vibrio mediterranei TaxID=689 RepID=UPI004067AF5B